MTRNTWPTSNGMTDAEYERLVERKDKQRWTPGDAERLKAKVRRVKRPECDYCLSGVPLRDGWHYLEDPEGVEGTARMPCMRERRHESIR